MRPYRDSGHIVRLAPRRSTPLPALRPLASACETPHGWHALHVRHVVLAVPRRLLLRRSDRIEQSARDAQGIGRMMNLTLDHNCIIHLDAETGQHLAIRANTAPHFGSISTVIEHDICQLEGGCSLVVTASADRQLVGAGVRQRRDYARERLLSSVRSLILSPPHKRTDYGFRLTRSSLPTVTSRGGAPLLTECTSTQTCGHASQR